MNTTINWSKSNSKLKKNPLKTIGFGLEAIKTCPNAGTCKQFCYATQGSYTWNSVQKPRRENYLSSKQEGFVDHAIIDLLNTPSAEAVRIHDSGDFYNQSYLNKWIDIAQSMPHIVFYAYTKSIHLDFSSKPDNLVIIQSYGGRLDHLIDESKPHAKVFATHADRIAAGYVDGTKTDEHAYSGTIKIGLVYHGTKKQTKEMELTV